MNKHLFVTDLDGTLLGRDSRVSPRSAAILNELIAQGVNFTVATARTPATVEPLLEGIDMRLPAIVVTGASLWDHRTCRYTQCRYIPYDRVSAILTCCRESRLSPMIYSPADDGVIDVYIPAAIPPAAIDFVAERSQLPLKRIYRCEPDARAMSRAILIFCVDQFEHINRAAEALKQSGTPCSFTAYADIYCPERGYLEIFDEGVSKAEAIRQVADSIGASHITVFGDNLNDLSMMEAADTAVAVENALEAVKTAADIVIGPNTADSVPLYIRSLFA